MTDIYDTLIIGAGPGGLSTAVYAGRAGLKTLLLEKGHAGGRINDTAEIHNYPGVPAESGEGLMQRFKQHVENFPSVEFLRATVSDIRRSGDLFEVVTWRRGSVLSHSLVLASGTRPRGSGIPAEHEFAGRGVAYCATCDGEFYRDKAIHVLGAGDQAIEEADWLTRYARKVTVIVIHEEGHLDCNRLAAEKAMRNPRIEFIWNSTLHDIQGGERVERLELQNVLTGELATIPTDGIFMFIGMVPQADFIPDWIKRDSHGYLITNVRCETSCPGVYAVGDLRNTPLRQVVTAAADGAIAATGVEHYLQEKADIATLLSADSGAMTVLFWDPYSSAQQAQLPAIEQALQAQSQVRRIDVTRHDLLFRQLELSATPALARYQNGTLLECKTIPLNTQA
ncbi:FAD-binding protein [Metakosakonia massiliensis]|uniref:Thioredoxin reductase n=1 Tax=Phytobacter massiliensis TaxID=1485952 RepID=A0A6N3B6S9_9ENTR